MRKVILAVVLILSMLLLYAKSNAATWAHLASKGVYVYYYDLDNIQDLSAITVKVRLKQTYKNKDSVIKYYQKYAAKDAGLELEDYSISTMVVNCADKVVGVKSIISYQKNGEIISHTNYKKINYIYIPTGSLYKTLYGKIC